MLFYVYVLFIRYIPKITFNFTEIDSKIEALTQLGPKMNDLEKLVTNYAEQINALDTGLSAQVMLYNYLEYFSK